MARLTERQRHHLETLAQMAPIAQHDHMLRMNGRTFMALYRSGFVAVDNTTGVHSVTDAGRTAARAPRPRLRRAS